MPLSFNVLLGLPRTRKTRVLFDIDLGSKWKFGQRPAFPGSWKIRVLGSWSWLIFSNRTHKFVVFFWFSLETLKTGVPQNRHALEASLDWSTVSRPQVLVVPLVKQSIMALKICATRIPTSTKANFRNFRETSNSFWGRFKALCKS